MFKLMDEKIIIIYAQKFCLPGPMDTHPKMSLTLGQLSKNFEHKIVIIYLFISLNMCFGCSKEPSHRERNKKKNSVILIWGPGLSICTVSPEPSLLTYINLGSICKLKLLYSFPCTFNSFLASSNFYCMLIIFANSLDPDQD